jgi:hypothetical protein
MRDPNVTAKLAEYRRRIADLRREMRSLHAALAPEQVRDYEFATIAGPYAYRASLERSATSS